MTGRTGLVREAFGKVSGAMPDQMGRQRWFMGNWSGIASFLGGIMAKVVEYGSLIGDGHDKLWRAECVQCARAGNVAGIGVLRPSAWAANRDKVAHELPGACATSRVESAAQRRNASAGFTMSEDVTVDEYGTD